MTDKQKAAAIILAAVAACLVLLGMRGGKGSQLTLFEASVGSSYDPYLHWIHGGGGTWVHKFPTTIGANCLGEAVQNEDESLSMRGLDYGAGSSQ